MKKSVIDLLILLIVVFLISAHSMPIPPLQFTDDTLYLSLGEKYYDQFYPNDRMYEIDLYMEDGSSFKSRTVSIRLNFHTDSYDSCFYSGFFTAVDAGNNYIQESMDGEADAGWTEWLEVYISLDVSKMDFDISHYCDSENPGWFEIEVLIEGETPVTPSPLINFWTDDQTISQGSCTNIYWDVDYASDVYFEDSRVSKYGNHNVCPQVTTDYFLEVLGEDGNWYSRSITIFVEEVNLPSPDILFNAEDYDLSAGECTEIYWEVMNAAEVKFEGELVNYYGDSIVCPEMTTQYKLDVLGEDGYWYDRTVTINVEEEVLPSPDISFYADAYHIFKGECTTIYWDVKDAEEVHFGGNFVANFDKSIVCPDDTSEYMLEVLGADGEWYSQRITINVGEPPTLELDIKFWADDYQITEGECTTIYWEVQDAEEVHFDGGFVANLDNSIVCPDDTSEYTLEVLGADGEWYSQRITINVDEPPIPELDIKFWADDYQITEGECTTIYWEVRDAEEVHFDGGFVANLDNSIVCPDDTSEYALEVLGADGEWYSQRITINVNEPLIPELEIKFWADDYQIAEGECTTISWDVVNAAEVWVDGEKKGFTGSQVVCPKSTADYVLEAWWLDGKGMTNPKVTISVDEINCRGKGGFILIVTDSELLNRLTEDNNTWKDVKAALENYYDSSADKCSGRAVFLDIAQLKKDYYPSYKFIDKQIEDFIKDMRVGVPAALAIIGGPNVIPHEPPAELDPFHGISDDIYADFDNDRLHSPDTVITRLPDGGSKAVLLNYINALERGSAPSGGALLVTDLRTSAHKLNFSQRSASMINAETFVNQSYLEDYIELQISGDVTHLITPPQVSQYRKFDTDYDNLIRVDDLVNADPAIASQKYSNLAASGVRDQLNNEIIVFGDFSISNDLGYYLSNISSQNISPTLYSPFSYVDADHFPEGAQVFSLVMQSALLTDPNGNGRLIPIAALNAGVHHFIGRTDYLPVFAQEKFKFDSQSFWDLDITQASGKFAAEYFRILCDDPATSFWDAKQVLYDDNDLSARYFLYFGLPERNDDTFGIYKPISRIKHPEPSTVALPPQPTGCPSGDLDDCDGDQLYDDLEYRLASTFVPYLIPDEDEDQLPIFRTVGENPFAVFWQVSPAVLDGKEGAWITYVFTYTSDGGAHDFDIDFADCAKCFAGTVIDYCECDPWPPWTKSALCCLSKVITFPTGVTVALSQTGTACTAIEIGIDQLTDFGVNYNTQRILSYHPGDNEAFRVFVERKSENWSLTHINWKRHHDGFNHEGHLQTLEEAKTDGLELFENSHPLLYVAEDKHAMYPTHDVCEGYEMHLTEYCKISFEHCSGHDIYTPTNPIRTSILRELNVGEDVATIWTTGGTKNTTFHLFEDMAPVFPGENVWEKREGEHFCGSLPPGGGWIDEPCAGPMGKLWYAGSKSLDID